MKRVLTYSIVFLCANLFAQYGLGQDVGKIKTIVIDAGHGGRDPGALGRKSKEKDIALAVALKTGHYIEQNLSGVKVVYTRKTDRFVELHRRGKIANDAKADLFISIHCNSNPSRKPYGAETYALGVENNRTNANLVAMTENASILLEENQDDIYDGFDPKAEESLINLTLFQSEHRDQSLDLANRIQKQFKNRVGRKDRGVHQAGFLVLWKTTMPSVLVELGYLSNTTEEAFLLSAKGQSYLASAIYRAVKEYKRDYESESGAYDYRKKAIEKQNDAENKGPGKNGNTISATNHKKSVKKNSELVFRVQFYTSPKKLNNNDSRLKSLDNIYIYQHNGMYKYTSGKFNSLAEAEKHKETIRKKGFADAFSVAFYKGERISISRAKQILNEK
ncbi:MAG: N-acetylmuramoyl-L-alanine amidase [Chlorobi bacterium]|nr:N-acetylmuramoyl-L-alanine amidase [Chlorobiota bacterium]